METLSKLTTIDKQLFYQSLKNIEHSLEDLVQKFYFYFLQTEAGVLFKETEMETHYKMFHVALAFLIAHIDNPVLLNKHLGLIVKNHVNYGVNSSHVPFFIDSFISALREFITEEERVIAIWNSVIYEIMSFFNQKLVEESSSHQATGIESGNLVGLKS